MDKDSLQSLLGQGLSIERIAKRFGKDPSTVAYWMKKHGLISPYREKHSAKGGIERGELECLIDAGLTIGELAQEFGRSRGAVRHWMRRYGLQTHRAKTRGARDASEGKDDGLATTECPARATGRRTSCSKAAATTGASAVVRRPSSGTGSG